MMFEGARGPAITLFEDEDDDADAATLIAAPVSGVTGIGVSTTPFAFGDCGVSVTPEIGSADPPEISG